MNFVYFGTSEFSTIVLEELKTQGYIPSLIITTPDKPQGRKLILTPSPVKIWAETHSVPVLQPANLKDGAFLAELQDRAPGGVWNVFIVASYGKIIPPIILDMPARHVLNVHPSLLPKLRGPSPIQSALLADMRHTGVTIMRLDAEMDHGPIVAQEAIDIETWPPTNIELEKILGKTGGMLLASILPDWISGTISEMDQDHTQATYTKKIEKTDGEIDLSADPYQNFLKIQAYADWPKAYFFIEKNGKKIRVIIAKAEYKNDTLTLVRVIPEGKAEMNYTDFVKGYRP